MLNGRPTPFDIFAQSQMHTRKVPLKVRNACSNSGTDISEKKMVPSILCYFSDGRHLGELPVVHSLLNANLRSRNTCGYEADGRSH